MASHGGSPISLEFLQHLGEKALASSAFPTMIADPLVIGDTPIPGFRHFLGNADGTLPLDARFKLDGTAPTFAADSQARLRGLMGRLAHRMSVPYAPADSDNGIMPAGYTYLLQLMAHDLVQSSLSASALGAEFNGVANHRGSRLNLDTLYGAGPDSNAIFYAASERRGGRSELRMGPIASRPADRCPYFRDVPRFAAPHESPPGLLDVLIADTRNDDNAILSQLTTLFHLLHNIIVRRFLPALSNAVQPRAVEEAALNNYFSARTIVTMIYRGVIRNDVMRRVLNRRIFEIYRGVSNVSSLLDPPDNRVPLEFSHAAFRFAHPMIRRRYDINDSFEGGTVGVINATSARSPQKMPLSRDWIVQWSRFFEIDRSSPNLSRRIQPNYTPGLLNDDLFPPPNDTGQPGLACRDLVSSVELGLWSVDQLISRLERLPPGGVGEAVAKCVSESRLLKDKEYRKQALAEWLADHAASHTLTDRNDIAMLADEPPLLFFIQFEALVEGADAHEPGGSRLGVLGSIIVAEVIFAALAERSRWEGGDIKETSALLNQRFFNGRWTLLEKVPSVADMKDVVKLVGDFHDRQPGEPDLI